MAPDISNENSGNTDWRNKLEDVDSLTMHLMVDKPATWNKLYGRMQARPRRKVVSWYWAAAAILILFAATGLFFSNKKITAPALARQVDRQPDKSVWQTQPVPNRSIPLTAATTGKQGTIAELRNRPVKNKLPRNGVVIAVPTITPSVKKVVPSPLSIPVPFNDSLMMNKTLVSIAAIPPIKRKLKVVHINELGYPEEVSHEAVPPADYGSIRFGLGNQPVYAVSNAASKGFQIPKVKSNSTN